jgi:hypothetical protein
MKYLDDKEEIIYDMKITIVNEFKYHFQESEDLCSIFFKPNMSLSFDDLKETCKLCLPFRMKDNLKKSDLLNLFNESLFELFLENIIEFGSNEMIMLTQKGETMFIEEKILYSSVAKKTP